MSQHIDRPRRNVRLSDNAQERILKRIEDQKMLDTTPNGNVNTMWQKQIRSRITDREMGPAFRYSHRNTVERLQDKVMKDPISSELINIDTGRQSPRRAAYGKSFDGNRFSHASPTQEGKDSPKPSLSINTSRGVRFAGDATPKVSNRRTANNQFRQSLPKMLPSYQKAKEIAVSPSQRTLIEEQQRSKSPKWRKFRPELHQKTFFKGATSLTMGIEASLCLKDETARELVKESFDAVGHAIPKQTFEERFKERHAHVMSEEFVAIDDLSETEEVQPAKK